VQDSDGNHITASYTGGRLTTLTHSAGQWLTLTYNAAGLVSTITDSAGRTTTCHYDPTNQYLTSAVDFDGQTTSYAYLCPGQVAGADFVRPVCRRGSQGTGQFNFAHRSMAA